MTDAQATVEFAIRNGLVQRAHLTGLRPDLIEFAVSDIVESLFSHATVWAVIEHAGTILVRARTMQEVIATLEAENERLRADVVALMTGNFDQWSNVP